MKKLQRKRSLKYTGEIDRTEQVDHNSRCYVQLQLQGRAYQVMM